MTSKNKGDGHGRDKSPANLPAGASCNICKEPDDSRMVACDRCAKWFHFSCVEEDSSVADRDWSCSNCAEVPVKPSTNTGAKPKPGNPKLNELGPDDSLQRQLAEMQKKLDKQLKEFERSLKEKDDQRRKALKDQQNKFDQELERRMREQKDAYQIAAAAFVHGGSAQTSAAPGGSQAAGLAALGGSQVVGSAALDAAQAAGSSKGSAAFRGGLAVGSAAFDGAQAAGSSKSSAAFRGGLAVGSAAFGDVPAASSTGIFNSQVSGISSVEILAQELQLLEEKQELERRHFEEKNQLFQRIVALDGGAADGVSGLNPQASSFRPANRSSLGYSMLSQNQVSARQAVNKELPTFSGNPEEWPLFFASYENSTRICGFSDEENLLRLQRSLKGRALEAVRCRLLHPTNLAGVIATLKTLYGRPEIIVHSLVSKIREMPAPKAEKLNTLIDFGVAVQNVCATIKASGLDEYLCNVALLQELTERLPPAIRLNWAYHRQTLERVTLSDFGDWLGKLVEAASVVTIPPIGGPKVEKRGRKEDNYLNVHSDSRTSEEAATKTRSVAVPKGCIVCREECSGLETCCKFLNMDIGARWTVIREQKLCRKCLRKHFGACHVKTACGKNGCSYMHSKLLHDDKRYNKPPTPEPAASTSSSGNSTAQSCNAHSNAASKVLFRYVPVTLFGKGKAVNTFAFLDDGSSATFIEHSLVKDLDLEGTSHPLCLNWTGGQQREENESVKLTLKISGTYDGSKVYELPKVHTVRNLSLPKQSVSVKQLESKYSYLRGLPLESYDNVSPRILIGMDNCRLGHALRSAEGNENEPVAAKTRLGWLVCGPCSMASGAANVGYSGYHSFHICPCSTESDKELDGALKEYFSIDSMGISVSSKSPVSKDEERALNILSSETCLKENRYETGLLWRFDKVKLPDNRAMAVRRLACLEKRMNRDPELAAAVREKMADLEAKGYLRKLSESEKAERHPNDWYLPIFPVINPNKPGKIRLVMDAAAKVNGVSLNSFLLTGPDQLVSLLTVLFRFREFRFAVVGDIREMFFQVLMRPQDQRSQMILWNGDDSSKEPDVYAVTVMTFGAACSPSSAHYVKNMNADRFAEQFPRAVESIKYEHYVDDMLSSVETEEEAVQLAKDVRYVHSQGGFEIRNWQSNSSKVMAALQEGTTSEKELSLCTETTSKVLGMWWNIDSDTFTFRLSPKHDTELLSGS